MKDKKKERKKYTTAGDIIPTAVFNDLLFSQCTIMHVNSLLKYLLSSACVNIMNSP